MGELTLAGGRRLRFEVYGAHSGPLVFLAHATPGSRVALGPDHSTLDRLGAQLVSYDRPGYGGSDRQPGRTVADAATDVAAIADALDVATFGVYGIGGGGPHALACAALLPDRVTRVAALGGPAPASAEGLDWLAGMSKSTVEEFTAARAGAEALATELAPALTRLREQPAAYLDALEVELPEPDRTVLAQPALRVQVAAGVVEALRGGPHGWIEDELALQHPWGFEPVSITAATMLWHGAQDVLAPVSHGDWLHREIPGSTFVRAAEQAHFGAYSAQDYALSWLLGDDAAPRRPSR
ncbi:MAG: alpha/beta fold hydrolase [Micromonosporaceae bacterium]